MGNVVIDMSMSLDGYIAAPNDNPEQGLGGRRLFDELPQRIELEQTGLSETTARRISSTASSGSADLSASGERAL